MPYNYVSLSQYGSVCDAMAMSVILLRSFSKRDERDIEEERKWTINTFVAFAVFVLHCVCKQQQQCIRKTTILDLAQYARNHTILFLSPDFYGIRTLSFPWPMNQWGASKLVESMEGVLSAQNYPFKFWFSNWNCDTVNAFPCSIYFRSTFSRATHSLYQIHYSLSLIGTCKALDCQIFVKILEKWETCCLLFVKFQFFVFVSSSSSAMWRM